MSLVQALPEGPLDIIGDIHGEYEAFCQLLGRLGYDQHGNHPQHRTLVLVGDFCDRGPDSPAVLELVEQLVARGKAVAVLGNHEMNLLRNDPKDGSGWYFEERRQSDQARYAPFRSMDNSAKEGTVAFLSTLPIALERADLRIIHAAWISDLVARVRPLTPADLIASFEQWDDAAKDEAAAIKPRMLDEKAAWPHSLEERSVVPPFLHAHADFDSVKQMHNPLRVLTSGVERKGREPFYAGGKWRFVDRVQWWNEYDDDIAVVVGHYWRRFAPIDGAAIGKGNADLFEGIAPNAWHGTRRNVFCVDFSVGGRWSARKSATGSEADFKLAALRWPECELRFDDGLTMQLDAPGNPALAP
jgi:hypothetical protein